MDLGGEAGADFGDLGTELEDLPADSSSGDEPEGMDLLPELDSEPEGMDLGGELESMDLGGELEDLSVDSSADMDASADSEADGMDLPAELGGELEDLDLGGEAGADGFDFSIEEPGIGGAAAETGAAAVPGDSFDNFDFNEAASVKPGGKSEFGELEEFSLPGIDDVLDNAIGPQKTAKSDALPSSDEVEEISLSDDELGQLQKTLSGYPLNLRIACEELIAEQAVAPDLMSNLIKLLVKGASAKETAALAGKILGRPIAIPRGFEKKTGEEMEAEQASFAYIFVHKFLPVLRLFLVIAVVLLSLGYLVFQFIYTPLRAEGIYKIGYQRIEAGEYERANERFSQAFRIHRNKNWFYRYAEGFRDERQYIYAEQKYDELLRFYPRDKKGALDYAGMETYRNDYDKADSILRHNILDFAPEDYEGLLALGDNALAWGEIDHSKYENARFSFARLLDKYGWTDPIVERMLKYFIRTDNLKEVLPLQARFMNGKDAKKRKISADTLAELGGYLLDKRLEEVRGVPNEYVEEIQGVREVLLRAVAADPGLPEAHYHLSRYYNNLGSTREERVTLERAIQAFDSAKEEPVRRLSYRIAAQRRYAEILTASREFFPAEQQLIKGINLYEDALRRRLVIPSPEFGRLYADLGDLTYFTKDGDMDLVLEYYSLSERSGWAPPEIQYRMGAAYYQLAKWPEAIERFFNASSKMPFNRRILYALGNTAYQRGDYGIAQGYYSRLLEILEGERLRLPELMPNDGPEYIELAERLMIARNNMGATLEALTERTGNNRYRSRAQALYVDSARAWDTLTRDPQTMVRLLPAPGVYGPGVNPPYLNIQNSLHPVSDYERHFFLPIDKDVLEPSPWENLAPLNARLPRGVEPEEVIVNN
jgi:tetratricopeptide (TPR) repeat protein